MDENLEPQSPASAPVAYPATYSALPPDYAAPSPPRAGLGVLARRTARLLARRVIYGVVLLSRALRPYAAFVAVIAVLLGVIAWMGYLLWWPKELPPAFERADSLPPAEAVQKFIEGQQSYNADLMWDAYSIDYQASQIANGATKAVLQAGANSDRSAGLRYARYQYIGGVRLEDGGSLYFYTVDLSLSTRYTRYQLVFTTDPDGKIIDVDAPFLRPAKN